MGTSEIDKSRPTGLTCELMAWPERTEISNLKPRFSWVVPFTCRGDRQSAYQTLVATKEGLLTEQDADLWNSGRVESDQSLAVAYAGSPLESHKSYTWEVRTWNRDGEPSGWSQPQVFRTGDLDAPRAERYTTPCYPLVQTEVAPTRVVRKAEGHFFFDFGQAAFGTVTFRATVPRDGVTVQVHLGEAPGPNDTVEREPGATIRYRQIAVVLATGTHPYRVAIPPDERNTGTYAVKMPADIGEVLPFRYCEVVGAPSGFDPSTVRQVRVHYPFDDEAARFTCSAPVLNDIWELCKYTMKATSFCGVYVDGDRERIPYEADAYINQLGHYCTDREFTLARYSHEYLILYPNWPTEWPLHSVLMAWADYMQTGDRRSITEFYDDLKAKTLSELAREDGLISTQTDRVTDELLDAIHMNNPRYVHGRKLDDLVDWPPGERDDYDFQPINTVVNALHYQAMALMGRIAADLGRREDAAEFVSAAERVAASINARLIDPTTGLYVDGEGSSHSSLHANMFPLAFGLVPSERLKPVIDFTKGKGMACSVYAAQYLMEALYEAGEADFAYRLMTDRATDRSWPHMLEVGTTIALEAWDNKYKPNQDWNHAWGAAPVNIIPRKLMGVEPTAPGFSSVRIRPQPGPLERASLDLPTIRGTIHVAFEERPDGTTQLNVGLPANMTATVHLPTATPEGVTEGGLPLSEAEDLSAWGVEDGRVVVEVGSGAYHFAAQPGPTR